MKTFLTALIVILGAHVASGQNTKPLNTDCESTISRSISEDGENGVTPVVLTKPNEFNIIIDSQLKPVNFISTLEKFYRRQVKKLDTSSFYLTIPNWKNLSPSQKLVVMEEQRVENDTKANAAHKANNINCQLIYIVNNTGNDVALQMQDNHFIGVLQARISPDKWQSVQYLIFSWCANSYVLKHIAAGNKAYFITPSLTGNYKITLRYKILGKDKFYYSNEFESLINYCDLYDTKHTPEQKLEVFTKYRMVD
jgi:hypothetical protein